jgi:hypothetical protein
MNPAETAEAIHFFAVTCTLLFPLFVVIPSILLVPMPMPQVRGGSHHERSATRKRQMEKVVSAYQQGQYSYNDHFFHYFSSRAPF